MRAREKQFLSVIRPMIAIHKPSDFKSFPGKILDAAKTNPQYVVRDGALLVLQRVEKWPEEFKLTSPS